MITRHATFYVEPVKWLYKEYEITERKVFKKRQQIANFWLGL